VQDKNLCTSKKTTLLDARVSEHVTIVITQVQDGNQDIGLAEHGKKNIKL
jgi:hypothetical protein